MKDLKQTIKTVIRGYMNESGNNTSKENVLINIGGFKLTKHDLDTKYRDKISKHFGDYNEDTIEKSLWTLYDAENLYKNGGVIYRVIWLKHKKYFDINNLGNHWLANKGDIENIIDLFATIRDNYEGDPYYIKAYTPPKNVSIPYDYFNNLEENEILVIDDKLLENIELFKI